MKAASALNFGARMHAAQTFPSTGIASVFGPSGSVNSSTNFATAFDPPAYASSSSQPPLPGWPTSRLSYLFGEQFGRAPCATAAAAHSDGHQPVVGCSLGEIRKTASDSSLRADLRFRGGDRDCVHIHHRQSCPVHGIALLALLGDLLDCRFHDLGGLRLHAATCPLDLVFASLNVALSIWVASRYGADAKVIQRLTVHLGAINIMCFALYRLIEIRERKVLAR